MPHTPEQIQEFKARLVEQDMRNILLNEKQVVEKMQEEETAIAEAMAKKEEAKRKAEQERIEKLEAEERAKEAAVAKAKAAKEATVAKAKAEKELQKLLKDPKSSKEVKRILENLKKTNLPLPRKLPKIPLNPDTAKFTRLVLVLPQVKLEKLVETVRVRGKKLVNRLSDLSKVKNAEGIKTPNKPYFVWMQNGLLYKGKSVNDATASFTENERGATLTEGLFFLICNPETTLYDSENPETTNNIDLPGSRYGGFVPCLYWYVDGPGLCARLPGYTLSQFGSASVGVSQ